MHPTGFGLVEKELWSLRRGIPPPMKKGKEIASFHRPILATQLCLPPHTHTKRHGLRLYHTFGRLIFPNHASSVCTLQQRPYRRIWSEGLRARHVYEGRRVSNVPILCAFWSQRQGLRQTESYEQHTVFQTFISRWCLPEAHEDTASSIE